MGKNDRCLYQTYLIYTHRNPQNRPPPIGYCWCASIPGPLQSSSTATSSTIVAMIPPPPHPTMMTSSTRSSTPSTRTRMRVMTSPLSRRGTTKTHPLSRSAQRSASCHPPCPTPFSEMLD
ncbi:hypothetical protein MUK42_24009 [Musa troglodytarum]|uniref:Uncharacterized protein n=1 Tax=Musa troglodytarum TaxID=320322 RepID=A0A9E7G8Y6_9LILI|nr:hypothetical protein MUK42_24009 [Musa troglodytarum]